MANTRISIDSRPYGFGTRFNDWSVLWNGVPTISTIDSSQTQVQGFRLGSDQTVDRTTPSLTQTPNSIPKSDDRRHPGAILHTVDHDTIDESVQPWVPATDIVTVGSRLAPFTPVYPFFDDKPLQAYWIQSNKIVLTSNSSVTNALSFLAHRAETVSTSSGGTGTVLLRPVPTSIANGTVSPVLHVVNMTGFWNIGDTIISSAGYRVNIANVLILTDNVAGSNPNMNQVNLASSAANTSNNHFVSTLINIAKGNGAGQIALITGYNANTRIANVSPSWLVAPDSSSIYSLGSPVTTGFGSVAGILCLPNDYNLRFTAGDHIVKLTSSPSNDTGNNVVTKCSANFIVRGKIDTSSSPVPSHRPATRLHDGDEMNETNNPVTTPTIQNPVPRPPTPVMTANNLISPASVGVFSVSIPPITANTFAGLNLDGGGAAGGVSSPIIGGHGSSFRINPL